MSARRMWKLYEPYHGVTYFAPEARAATDALGCRGGWMGYFGLRAAPLGPVSPEIIAAIFYNFKLERVARSIPTAWTIATPEQFLEARLAGVDAGLRAILGDDVLSDDMIEASQLAQRAALATPIGGRPLAAANVALPWPDPPHLVLWHATTILRESRGDGHVSALVAAGLDPVETLVAFAADRDTADQEGWEHWRGWNLDDWAAAQRRLRERGLLDKENRITADGSRARHDVETRTDDAAELPWQVLGNAGTERLAVLMTGFLRRIVAAGVGVIKPHPMALDLAAIAEE
ncbi:SCO6745 family protein [Kutzneria sp. CA-103260]|uniref:SCO6745 family protein n=1 Tax=Kutzneria sp. CA-103260 TaxID=2802641 RepID=UPI001BA73CA6|nr:hypothetical protein [Kutzneria sp. CA-103260]QUQ71280.1 hypothetical protein JJ691_90650 [Kutzneria sp. CA-103260]